MAEPLGLRFAKLWTASTASALGSGLATIAAHTKNPLVIVSATTWRVFNRATVARAYAEPALTE